MGLPERDIAFLKELYKNKIFGAGQIKKGYYGNMSYGYNRIRKLKKLGYLDSEPYVEGRQKMTEVYWITNKGIAEVEIDNPREAYKNKPSDKYATYRQLLINDVPVNFRHLENQNNKNLHNNYTWDWLDSRETKESFSINRGDIISGSLYNNNTGERYAVYVPGSTQDEEKQIERHRNEIDRHNVLRDNIIFCTTTNLFKQFRKMRPAGRSLKVLPFNEGIALMYNLLTEQNQLLELYSKEMQINKNDIAECPTIFSTHKAGNIHLVELLSNDTVMQNNIAKIYMTNKTQAPLNVLCWDTQLKEIKFWTNDERIKLFPLKWIGSPLFKGTDSSYRQLGRTRKLPESEKWKHIGARVPPDLYLFIETVKNHKETTISSIVTEALKNSVLYKQYLNGEFNDLS